MKEEKGNKREGMNQLHFISITLIAAMNDFSGNIMRDREKEIMGENKQVWEVQRKKKRKEKGQEKSGEYVSKQ